jgi:AcrR family transcriptional regulator
MDIAMKSKKKKPGRKKPRKNAASKRSKKSSRTRSVAKASSRTRISSRSNKSAWSGAREEQHRLKREAILRVASRLINRKGYAGMSLTDIADELEIKNASLYYYFKSKEALVFACFERAQQIVGETLASVNKSDGSGLEAIELYVVAIRDRIRREGELPVAANVWSLRRAHMKVIITYELAHVGRIANLIERGIEDGSIRNCNVPLVTTMLFSALRAVPGHYLGVDPKDWPELDEEVVRTVRQFLEA